MLPIDPVNSTFPSLINLAFRLLAISPSITFEPATFPTLETLKIACTSADPTISSLISGLSKPDSKSFTKSKAS